ncbi:MAG TPA: HisA/HisF-related TIM barrel protein [Candidatus Limnocylindrales bacterium]|nr:HisA/HisF-related TIM barrel protein [Candidatus Limnocylindrales bacterium]
MLVIPSIDVENGRSRLVYWPGAAAGVGSPTDRPERIAERFVAQGAQLIHFVDMDGARAGRPVNLEAFGRVAGRVAVPLQVAGGMEGADNIRLAFAAGATRVVVSMTVADRPELLRECLAVAGDWLAVGLDLRPERIAAYPWHRPAPPSLEELAGELTDQGVHRLVLSHGGARPDLGFLAGLARTLGVELFVAGGSVDLDAIRGLRDAAIAGIILGEPLLSGAVDFAKALEAAA